MTHKYMNTVFNTTYMKRHVTQKNITLKYYLLLADWKQLKNFTTDSAGRALENNHFHILLISIKYYINPVEDYLALLKNNIMYFSL